MRAARVAGAISWALSSACGANAPELGAHEAAIVYGADDRRDVYEVEDAALRSRMQRSIVALVLKNQVLKPAAGGVKLLYDTLAETRTQIEDGGSFFPMCAGQPFLDQPVLADCTGVLIDDDLVLTAAHCFSDQRRCSEYMFVFDYFERAKGELESVSESDVYRCAEVVTETLRADGNGTKIDFAVVRLDRAPTSREPVTLRREVLKNDEPLTTIGFPSGLPAKIDRGARVIDARTSERDFFFLDSDTFKGSSGSGIFDEQGKLAGVLVRGGADFVMARGEQCLVTNTVDVDGGTPADTYEEATYAMRALDALCLARYPTERLCNIAPRCGDGFCTAAESVLSCPDDCHAETCLGARCGKARDIATLGDVVEPEDAGLPQTDDAGSEVTLEGESAEGCSLVSRAAPSGWPLLALWYARRRRGVTRGR